MNQFIQSWLLQCFVIFLIVGSLAGMVAGALLLLRPQSLQRTNSLLNRWVSTRHLDQSLERTVALDPFFYRHRRASGALMLLGALYILYFFAVRMDRPEMIGGLARSFKMPVQLVSGLLDALTLSALTGAMFAVAISLFLLLRPSLLRNFEQGANRWVSMRRALKPMEMQRSGMDEYVFKYSQQAGILLVFGSLYVLVILLFWFGH
ncbi:hypothetical protein [Sideroxydans lithotrophicus]|uniref:Uncharacterized protein n=1 Tax=Sideroxydans lithotrophicus (strain ES-1) TaxID=580332 RepID=D5CND3_SIDLE|nr:hypothetical protein [Sideroxydans lithotrophicus]ADE12830.1 conserved hypothetical protein [Sideroxydans lithotrophicus ES-1]